MPESQENTTSPQLQQTTQPPQSQNWWEKFLVKIGSTGGAIIVLLTVAGSFFEAGRKYMENEKNLQIFDLKSEHQKEKDSLKELQIKLKTELDSIKNIKENVRKKRK